MDEHIKILVVDDQEADRKALADCVRSLGYEVFLADSGEVALEMVEQERADFSLVLTDRQMPEMGGLELLKRLKNYDPMLDVIVVTAQGDVDTAVDAIRSGASNYIIKPIKRSQVLERIQAILERRNQVRAGAIPKNLTVFFSDIRNFTELSEKTDPQVLSQFLNRYLGVMSDIIKSHRGTLDKYIGDTIMAFWDLPEGENHQAELALLAAAEMQEKIKALNLELQEKFGFSIECGIGINSGPVAIGNIGGEKNFQYTVIGDHVNLASRIETVNRVYGTHLLVSQSTFALLKKDTLAFREIDTVRLKGKAIPITLFEIFSPTHCPPNHVLKRYSQGLDLYKKGSFAAALVEFEAVISEWPEDGPSTELIKRCQQLSIRARPERWDGVWKF